MPLSFVGEIIYICGGSNGQSDLSTCLKFDVNTNEWTNIPNMSMARSCPGKFIY